MTDYKFQSWTGQDETAADGNLKLLELEPQPWDEDDIDIKILYSGICGSDLSGLAGHFGPVGKDRVCGHEIVGEVVRAGPKVENGIKVGDMVGVGPYCDSCGECEFCTSDRGQFCANTRYTYGGSTFPRGHAKGAPTRGGFARYWRGPSRWAIPIPKGLDPAAAAPLMCAGNTVYSPLARFGAGTRAKKVGVVGIGGLGHIAIMFAKAMGAEVTAISRGTGKREDAFKLGADHYIATGTDLQKDFADHKRSLDLVICTINPPTLPLDDYITLLRPEGNFVLQGIVINPIQFQFWPLLEIAGSVSGSNPCSQKGTAEMLALAADKGIEPWIQKYDMKDINTALLDFKAGKPKFRFVLVNTDNGAKL